MLWPDAAGFVTRYLRIIDNAKLSELGELADITRITGMIEVRGNPQLPSEVVCELAERVSVASRKPAPGESHPASRYEIGHNAGAHSCSSN